MSAGKRTVRIATIFTVMLLCSPSLTVGQGVNTQTKGELGEIGMLREVGAVLIEEDGQLKFLVVMPSDQRPEAYRSVDLKQDDILLMFNGKRIKTVSDLTAAYDTLKAGDEIKLGIKRGVDMRIVSLPKADPDDLPKMQMMTMTAEEGEERVKVTTSTSAGAEPLTVLAEIGLVVKDLEGAVVVAMLLPHAEDVLESSPIFEGDRIVSLQDQEITSAEMLGQLFDAIKVGETVKLVYEHEGKELVASLEKPEAQAKPRMIIRKQ